MQQLIKKNKVKQRNILTLFLQFLNNHKLVPTFTSLQLYFDTNFDNLTDEEIENNLELINKYVSAHLESEALLKNYDSKIAIYLLTNHQNDFFSVGNIVVKFFYE